MGKSGGKVVIDDHEMPKARSTFLHLLHVENMFASKLRVIDERREKSVALVGFVLALECVNCMIAM